MIAAHETPLAPARRSRPAPSLSRCARPHARRRRTPPAPPTPAAAPTAAKPAPAVADAADGIAWKQGDAATPTSTPPSRSPAPRPSRCFVYWGASGARRATRSRRRSSTARTSSSAPAPSCRSTSTATAPARRSSARAFGSAAIRRWCCFKPSGEELTRLPGEVDPARYTQLLTLGMNAPGRSRRCSPTRSPAARPGGERLAPARLLFLGDRRAAGASRKDEVAGDAGQARRRLPGRPARDGDAPVASRRWPRATPRRRPRPTSRPAPRSRRRRPAGGRARRRRRATQLRRRHRPRARRAGHARARRSS